MNHEAYGVVVGNIFHRHKWQEINKGKEPPKIVNKEVSIPKPVDDSFWEHFEEITSGQYNDLWAKDYLATG